MSRKFTSTRRCYLIDHHSPQPPDVLLNNLNILEYEEFFKTAHIDSLMVYCKDHWGVTYYPSGVDGAQIHEGIDEDWIQQISTTLKKMEIEFVAYYCIEYDEGAARRFPEWTVKKPDGSPLIRDDEFAKWQLCCYQTGYREYCLRQLEEIVSNYKPDALFLDIFGASLCHCESCRSRFLSMFHYPLPETEDEILLHRQDITAFLNHNAACFLDELKRRVNSIDPSLAVTINFSCHYPQEIRDKLDYQFSEPLLKDNWFSSAYARDTAIGQYPILVPGEASQVYNYSTVNEYICDLSSIAAQGCRVGMYSGSQHIDGTLDFEEARRLGQAFREIEKMEPYLIGRDPVRCAGIIQSDLSMSINLSTLHPDAIIRMKRHNPHQNAVLGAMELCERSKIPFMVLPERTLSQELLAQYELLLLPEVFVIEDTIAALLNEYVSNGGLLISSGQSGLWNADSSKRSSSTLSGLFGIQEAAIHTEYQANRWSAYLNNTGIREFTGLLSCTTPPVSEHFIETKAIDSKETLLTFLHPCVACDSEHWVNWWSPPPGVDSNSPALIYGRNRLGSTYYFAFDFFTMASQESFQYPHEIFADILLAERIQPPVRNKTAVPEILRTAYFETQNEYIVHQISMIPKRFHGNITPVSGGCLEFPFPLQQAELVYPCHEVLEVQCENENTIVSLPSFDLQQIIVCKKSVAADRPSDALYEN